MGIRPSWLPLDLLSLQCRSTGFLRDPRGLTSRRLRLSFLIQPRTLRITHDPGDRLKARSPNTQPETSRTYELPERPPSRMRVYYYTRVLRVLMIIIREHMGLESLRTPKDFSNVSSKK
jgi:hypothetical protein